MRSSTNSITPSTAPPTRVPTPSPIILPLRAALLAQLGGLLAVLVMLIAIGQLLPLSLQQLAALAPVHFLLAMLQGAGAALIAYRQRAPRWWLAIHLGFAPLALAVQWLAIDPRWFLAGFILLFLVFWRTDQSRVPLYLSNRATALELVRQLPAIPCRVLDLGCGTGGLLCRLAQARPDCRFVGIEHAPLTWLVAWLRTRGLANIVVRRADFWTAALGDYDLVYAFLSPAPMLRLGRQASADMAPGSLLISNSFAIPVAIPGVTLEEIISVTDRRATRLYRYRIMPADHHPIDYLIDKTDDSTAFPDIPRPANRQ